VLRTASCADIGQHRAQARPRAADPGGHGALRYTQGLSDRAIAVAVIGVAQGRRPAWREAALAQTEARGDCHAPDRPAVRPGELPRRPRRSIPDNFRDP
jgi:hypothetical protein